MMMSTPMLVARMKISPSTYLVELGMSTMGVKTSATTSPDVYKIGMVSRTTVML